MRAMVPARKRSPIAANMAGGWPAKVGNIKRSPSRNLLATASALHSRFLYSDGQSLFETMPSPSLRPDSGAAPQ
jgi:hypothetical protein